MFLTEDDYIVASSTALGVLQQSSEDKRNTAERMAVEEVSGYLRSRYDVKKIFAATGGERNDVVVMRTCDVALYHLSSWLPNRMGHEIRKERYELALKWLEGVQAGKITPDLPTVTGEDGEEDVNNPMKWGSEKKNTYIW
jgi:phage gp36-like protein|nr:MAG TPA: head to tail adaptor [Caudoviricetes sp.]